MNIVKWSSQGMLRLTQEAMNELFQPTINNIVKHIGEKKNDHHAQRHTNRRAQQPGGLGPRWPLFGGGSYFPKVSVGLKEAVSRKTGTSQAAKAKINS